MMKTLLSNEGISFGSYCDELQDSMCNLAELSTFKTNIRSVYSLLRKTRSFSTILYGWDHQSG